MTKTGEKEQVSDGRTRHHSAQAPAGGPGATEESQDSGLGIRFRLACLVAACVLPVLLGSGFLVYHSYQLKRELMDRNMLQTARALTQVVDRELANMQTSLTVLATSPSLDSGNLKAFHHQAQMVLQSYEGGDIILADATGQQLVNSFRPYGTSLPRRNVPDEVRRVYATGKPNISNLFKGAVTGRPLIGVDVPVIRDGRVIYDLAMTLPADRLAAVLSQQHLPPDWIGTILDGDHVVVSRTRFPEKYIGRHATTAMQIAVQKIEGTVELANIEGTRMFDGFNRSAMSGWTVVVGVPKSIFMEEVWRWLWWTIAGAALLSFLGIWLAVLIAQSVARIEEALRQNREWLRVTLSSIGDAVLTTDTKGRVTFLNPVAANLTGWQSGEAEGKPVQNVFSIIHEKTRMASEDLVSRVLKERRAVELANHTALLARDGREIPIEDSAAPIWDKNGKIIGVVIVFHDVAERRRTEDALRESEARLQLFVEHAPAGLAMFDKQMRYLHASHRWATDYHFGDRDLRGLSHYEVFPEIPKRWKENHLRGLAGEVVRSDGDRFERADGSVQWIRWEIRPWRDSKGEVGGIVIFSEDITERKQAEQRIAHLASFPELNANPIFEIDLDEKITYANPSALRQFPMLLEAGVRHPLLEDLSSVIASLRSGTERSFVREVENDGRVFFQRIHYLSELKVMRFYFTDITERKQAEEALRSSQAKLQSIVGSAMDAVISVDKQQRIVLFNRAAEAVFQCTASEALGSTLDRFIPKLQREIHREHVRRFGIEGVSQRSMTSPAILAGVRNNGEEFPIEATISQVQANGERLYTVILRDITGRKQAEQALLRSEKLASVGRMAATIAHEINNPLAATTNALYIAMSQKDLPEAARHYLEAADSELRRIAHITRQSLGFYREFNAPALTSVNAVLESAIDLLNSKIKAKQAVIEKEWGEDVEVTAVAGELRQVFSNLLANSLDAIDQKGTIKLRVSAGRAQKDGLRCVRVTIADNGYGIPAGSRQHLFEPFFTTKGTIGTGLGLWVSKQIIDKHEGTIKVRSASGSCRGTVFSIVLPAEPAKTARSHAAGTSN